LLCNCHERWPRRQISIASGCEHDSRYHWAKRGILFSPRIFFGIRRRLAMACYGVFPSAFFGGSGVGFGLVMELFALMMTLSISIIPFGSRRYFFDQRPTSSAHEVHGLPLTGSSSFSCLLSFGFGKHETIVLLLCFQII